MGNLYVLCRQIFILYNNTMKKICSKCSEVKSLFDFYKAPWCADGYRPECKKCQNFLGGINQKKRKKLDPEKFYGIKFKSKFGIDFEIYKLMLEDQNCACAICKSVDPGNSNQYFCLDHCHKTGRVRGLLCYDCNVAIGFFKDNVEALATAIEYLNG